MMEQRVERAIAPWLLAARIMLLRFEYALSRFDRLTLVASGFLRSAGYG